MQEKDIKVTRIFMAEIMVRNLNLFVFGLYSNFFVVPPHIPEETLGLVYFFGMLETKITKFQNSKRLATFGRNFLESPLDKMISHWNPC